MIRFNFWCFSCIAILLLQIVEVKCRGGHNGHHSHHHSRSSRSSFSKPLLSTEEVDTDENYDQTEEITEEENSNVDEYESYGNESENLSLTASRCLLGLCYELLRDSTHYRNCSYRNTISFAEYNNIILNSLTFLNIRFWVGVKQNTQYGYFEWLGIGGNYGLIFDETGYTGGSCVILGLGLTNTFITEYCNRSNVGLCVYRRTETTKTYCDLYEEICGTSSNCYCNSNAQNFTCQIGCEDMTVNSKCDQCAKRFDEYPDPVIRLQYAMSEHLIYIIVSNSLKLSYSNDDKLIFCFTDVYSASTTQIRGRYSSDEINLVETRGDTVIYSITPKNLGPGHYWCEAFQNPDMTKVNSNVIIANIPETHGVNFVLNITVRLRENHTLLPYNIHTRARETLLGAIENEIDFISIRPAYISPLFNKNTNVNISFHLTTAIHTDATTIYTNLVTDLQSLNSDEIEIEDLTNSESCIQSTTVMDDQDISWPETRLGETTPPIGIFLQESGVPITRDCEGSFQLGAEWSEVRGIIANNAYSEITRELHDLTNSNLPANELNEALNDLIADHDDYIAYDVFLIAQIFEKIAQSNEDFDMDLFAENVNVVMEIDEDILKQSQIVLNATDMILYNFDLALISSISGKDTVTTIKSDHIVAQVFDLKKTDIIGIAIYGNVNKYVMTNLTQGTTIENLDYKNLIFATLLPPDLLTQILEFGKDTDGINMVTAIFFNDALFNSKDVTSSVSLILSLFVEGFGAVYLNDVIPVIFKPIRGNNGDKQCGFWNYGVDELWVKIRGEWEVDNETIYNENYLICNFTHMTHFALLVNGVENKFLNIVSIIGCVLSILGIIGIFATAAIFKSWREGPGTKILLNYCLAILVQMLVLLFSDFINPKKQIVLCIFCGMILHYTILAQFLWMLVISYLQYRKFVQVLVQEPPKIVMKSCLFAWVSPITLLIIVAASDLNSYRSNNTCYLSGFSLYLALFLPIIAVISVNLIMFVLIFKSVLYKKTKAYGVNTKLISLKIKLAVFLFFLMGFSWIFGLFAGFLKSLFLSYVFCLTATIQGLIMYLYFVVYNKSARHLWLKKIDKMKGTFSKRSKLENEDSKICTTSEEVKWRK